MMQAIELPSLAEQVRTLPAEGAARTRQLYRLVDLHSWAEAAAALHAAANADGLAGKVFTAAGVVLGESAGLAAGDPAARTTLREAVTSPDFLSSVTAWSRELRRIASSLPQTGACTLASAFDLWSWTVNDFLIGEGSRGPSASAAIDELAEALCPLLAARAFVLETSTPETSELQRDLCDVYAARVSAAAGATCAELVFGYRRHLVWDTEGCATCYASDDLDELEAIMPGFAAGAGTTPDILGADGSHPAKAGPCVRFNGLDKFMKLRNRLDGCLTGARIAKDRAVASVARTEAGGR